MSYRYVAGGAVVLVLVAASAYVVGRAIHKNEKLDRCGGKIVDAEYVVVDWDKMDACGAMEPFRDESDPARPLSVRQREMRGWIGKWVTIDGTFKETLAFVKRPGDEKFVFTQASSGVNSVVIFGNMKKLFLVTERPATKATWVYVLDPDRQRRIPVGATAHREYDKRRQLKDFIRNAFGIGFSPDDSKVLVGVRCVYFSGDQGSRPAEDPAPLYCVIASTDGGLLWATDAKSDEWWKKE